MIEDGAIVAEVEQQYFGYKLSYGTRYSLKEHKQVTLSSGVSLWAEGVRHAAECDAEYIYWKGFPDLDQAIRDFVNAGGEL